MTATTTWVSYPWLPIEANMTGARIGKGKKDNKESQFDSLLDGLDDYSEFK